MTSKLRPLQELCTGPQGAQAVQQRGLAYETNGRFSKSFPFPQSLPIELGAEEQLLELEAEYWMREATGIHDGWHNWTSGLPQFRKQSKTTGDPVDSMGTPEVVRSTVLHAAEVGIDPATAGSGEPPQMITDPVPSGTLDPPVEIGNPTLTAALSG